MLHASVCVLFFVYTKQRIDSREWHDGKQFFP